MWREPWLLSEINLDFVNLGRGRMIQPGPFDSVVTLVIAPG